jgi:hypothetical protein
VLEEWAAALARELGVDYAGDTKALLAVARDAAHNVDRPAAPLTTFLVGYAAALRGGGAEAVREAGETASRLALSWGERASDRHSQHSQHSPDGGDDPDGTAQG